MRINNSEAITFTANRTAHNTKAMEKSLQRLGSGLKIAKGSENASGISISETMRAQIRGISQAQRNMQDGLSLLESSNEGLSNVNELLQRARELSVMNATDTLTDADRQTSQLELDQILTSIDETAMNLEFNTHKILNDRGPLHLQVGANPGQKITIDTVDVRTITLGIEGASFDSREAADALITKFDEAILKVGNSLVEVGSKMEMIEHHLNNAFVFENNLSKSLSLLEDTDIAKEMMNFSSIDIRQKGDLLLIDSVNDNYKSVMNILSK